MTDCNLYLHPKIFIALNMSEFVGNVLEIMLLLFLFGGLLNDAVTN